MKQILFVTVIALLVTAGSAVAQMGGGGNMMGAGQHPQAQMQAQQGVQPNYGVMGYGMYPGMMPGYGMQQPGTGYGMGHMYPGMMGGYGMHQPMMGYGMGHMHPGMMPGYGMQQPGTGYGMGHMYSGMMGGYGMHQPMMGYGSGFGVNPNMMGYGMPHMFPGSGGDGEKQRAFLKETSTLRKKLHDLMFDQMEARWNPDTKPEQLEKLGKEMQKLQQELHEKSSGMMK